jgi:hypothetical protein
VPADALFLRRAWHRSCDFNIIMRTTTAVLLAAAAALACHGRTAPAQRAQQQYDVVQEGQTSSATTSVGAPGEVRPPVTTATNTDTTGSFTLGTAPPPANMPGGPAAGVLPPQQPGAMTPTSVPPSMASAPAAPIQRSPTTVQPAPVATNTQPPPPPRTTDRRPSRSTQPATTTTTTTSSDTSGTATTDTTGTTAPTTQTQTTDTTSTDQKPKKDDSKKKDSGDKTDTSAPPPPPPPTQTDTIGGN